MESKELDSLSEQKPYPAMVTTQETNKQPHDLVVEISEGTVEANKQPEEAGTHSKDDKGDDESTLEIQEETNIEYITSDNDVASPSQEHSSPIPKWVHKYDAERRRKLAELKAVKRELAELKAARPRPLYKKFGRWMANIVRRSNKNEQGDDESTSEIEEEDSMSHSLSFSSDNVVASSSQKHHPEISASLEIETEPHMMGINQQSPSSPDPNWLAEFKVFRSAAERTHLNRPSGTRPLYKKFGRWMANIVRRSNENEQDTDPYPRLPYETLITQIQAEDQSIHKQHIDIIFDKWDEAESKKWQELKTIPLTPGGDTALHLAVSLNRPSFVEGLVGLMTPQDLEIPNEDGNTAFCICASSGRFEFARIMLSKNPNLARITGQNGMFPIQMAASGGHRLLLQLLLNMQRVGSEWDYRLYLAFHHHVQLFFTTLENGMYGLAYGMLSDFPRLAAARGDGEFTALHVLARKPPDDPGQVNKDENPNGYTYLIEELWAIIQFMEYNEMLDLIRRPTGVLFEAAQSGNRIVLDLFLRSNPELLTEVDSKRRNLFHISVLYRQETTFIRMIKNGIFKDLVMQAVDEDLNNILHVAGMLPPHERFGSSRPDIQIQRELLWFKEVEKRVPTGLKTMRNKDGKTPKDIFNNEHRGLIDKGKKAVKDTADYGMVVATIIATIVFAASLTVPGHDASPDANSSILQKKGWYMIFILSDAVALFSSSSSIILFLSVLTSGFNEDEFISSLQIRLMFGVTTLFLAITTMVIAFTAACLLIFNHQSTWVAYLVASLGSLTVALFALLLYTLFGDLIRSLYWSRHLFQPPHYCQKIKSQIIVFLRLMKGLTFKVRYKLGKMCQNPEAKKRHQEDNPIVGP